MVKTCTRCKLTLPVSEFFRYKDGYQVYCKPCKYAKQREWRKTPSGQQYKTVRKQRGEYRRDHLKRRYDITEEKYEALLTQAGGVCEICKQPPAKLLYVDHCHNSGVVRGLLCRACNLVLGNAKDNPEILRQAINYLASRPELS